jgi:hypothetical protein
MSVAIGEMALRQLLPGQIVWADLDGQERPVVADKWDDGTDAVEVFYPPVDPSVPKAGISQRVERTIASSGKYRPNDLERWPALFR